MVEEVKTVVVLGATGSVGQSTLAVVSRHPGRFRLFALTAYRRVDEAERLCRQFRPRFFVMVDDNAAQQLRALIADLETEVLAGSEALSTIVAEPEVTTVMAAIVGGAGLQPTLAAVSAGKTVLLANKESLVMAGPLFMETVRNNGGQLLPIDSEQNAMFQSLPGFKIGQSLTNLGVEKLWLTASGGPFLTSPLSELESVTPEQACAHPNWEMGRKISVDSATMMNKGLEVIETAWFFGVDGAQIEVVVHPQSVIHSLVEYCDGSTLAQLGSADMRIPIAHALAWPERMFSGAARLDLRTVGSLDFQPVDLLKFPCLRLAYEALAAGGSVPAQMNAANEVAVESFLQGGVQFLQIAQVVEEVLQRLSGRPLENLESVLAVDDEARDTALMVIQGLNS